MIGAIVHQLTRNLTEEQIKTAGFDTYFVDRTAGVYPTAASGFPYSAASMACKGDLIADLTEDLAAEQKARVTYDNILRLSDDPDVNDVIKFLRQREVVHFQRFGEANRTGLSRFYSPWAASYRAYLTAWHPPAPKSTLDMGALFPYPVCLLKSPAATAVSCTRR